MQTLGIIESYYPSFTKSEKRIADFIIESNSKVIDLTLSELAVAERGRSDNCTILSENEAERISGIEIFIGNRR